jgi:hypothetical protein
MARKKRMKQAQTTGPKKIKGAAEGPGRKATFGHGMGGMFGSVTPKKPGFDKPSPTRAATRQQRAARMARLSNKLI